MEGLSVFKSTASNAVLAEIVLFLLQSVNLYKYLKMKNENVLAEKGLLVRVNVSGSC